MTMLPILVQASRSMCPVLQVANQNDLTKAVALVNDPQSNATESFASPPEFSSLQLAEMEEDEYATVTSLAPSETAFLKDASPTPSAASNSAKPVGNRLAFGLPAIPLWSLPLLVWVVVTGFFCIRALLKRIFLARILRNSIIVTEERTLQILRSVAGQHRMRDVPLLCSDTLRVPIAIGVIHPSIVLPSGYGKWSDERRNPLNALVGRPASQLPIKGWIGPQPDLQGKSYLLHFWATWCGPCKRDIPLLNELAKNSLVIGVHPDGTPVDEIRSEMSDKKMIYPTIVLEASPKDALGYPVSMYPYCIKFNDNGIVEAHGTLSEVSGTKRSITNAVDTSVKSTAVGKVIAIDSEEGLVQVSLGNESGLKVQQILDVVRDGKRVAQLRVVVLGKYGDQSIGKVLAQDELHLIALGDAVQF